MFEEIPFERKKELYNSLEKIKNEDNILELTGNYKEQIFLAYIKGILDFIALKEYVEKEENMRLFERLI